MQIRWVFHILPVFVFMVNKIPFMPFAKGWTPGPISLVVKGSTEDIIIHELEHGKQFYKLPIIFWILYLFQSWRLQFEAEAYAVQARYIMEHDNTAIENKVISDLALYLSEDYRLNHTLEYFKAAILVYYNKDMI